MLRCYTVITKPGKFSLLLTPEHKGNNNKKKNNRQNTLIFTSLPKPEYLFLLFPLVHTANPESTYTGLTSAKTSRL